ncbi:MAG: GGDEF domain-containing protein [Alphaproteobacteria bacterium]|uniref:diguanylate cyclase n=1 Tax=Candidatus Nitrobium versatile TaxID=2884831 RepID=A0A953JEC9_9BACT|nr:GGDEF domain-containing protein [Candidatus Nitrobium versatile]
MKEGTPCPSPENTHSDTFKGAAFIAVWCSRIEIWIKQARSSLHLLGTVFLVYTFNSGSKLPIDRTAFAFDRLDGRHPYHLIITMVNPGKGMEDILINDIIRACLAIDAKAATIYEILSKSAEIADLKLFWQRMAMEERKHIRFWKELSRLAKKGMVPQVFESPEQVLADIRKIEEKTRELLEQSRKGPDITTGFLIAYRLEFYALHPAFETLFQSAIKLDGSRFNPEDEYEEHINHFIEAMNKYGRVTPEIELLGESLQRLWKNNKILARQSSIDELTGILNRRGFFNLVRPFSHLAQRNKYQIGILLIDIDHFKAINDRYGHQAGDRVLADVARILRENLRTSDVLGRYGGEEFIIFVAPLSPESLSTIAEKESLSAMAEKLRSKVEETTKRTIRVTISIGASYGRIETDAEKEVLRLIALADKCLYDAKEQGRNRIICFSALSPE